MSSGWRGAGAHSPAARQGSHGGMGDARGRMGCPATGPAAWSARRHLCRGKGAAVVRSLLRSPRRTPSAILCLGPSAIIAAVSKTQNRTKVTRAAPDSRCSGTTEDTLLSFYNPALRRPSLTVGLRIIVFHTRPEW